MFAVCSRTRQYNNSQILLTRVQKKLTFPLLLTFSPLSQHTTNEPIAHFAGAILSGDSSSWPHALRAAASAEMCGLSAFHRSARVSPASQNDLFQPHFLLYSLLENSTFVVVVLVARVCSGKHDWRSILSAWPENLTLYGPYTLESVVHDGFAFIKKGGFPYVKYGNNWHVKG